MVTWVALAVVPLSDVASLAMPATRSRQVTQVEVMQVQGVNTIQPNMYSFLAATTKHEDGLGAIQKKHLIGVSLLTMSKCKNAYSLYPSMSNCPIPSMYRPFSH